jgi:hypothetical protein
MYVKWLKKNLPLKVAMEEPIVLETICIGPDTRKRKIPCRRELLILSLQRFYNTSDDVQKLIPILKSEGDLSLRLIDWFVTNYAKKHHTSYELNGQEFNVYLNYKSQLKAFSKKLFDPFCRRERILFQCGTMEPFETTVGQLNFFRWAFEKNILSYIRTNMNDIVREEKQARAQGTQSSTDSNSSNATTISNQSCITISTTGSSSSSKSTRRRRIEKSVASTQMVQKHDLEIKLCFD